MGFIGKGKLGWAIYEVDFIRFVNYIGYIIIDIKVKSFFFFLLDFVVMMIMLFVLWEL